MKFEDLKGMYSEIQLVEGMEAYKTVSQLFHEAKERHKQNFLRDNPMETMNRVGGLSRERILKS